MRKLCVFVCAIVLLAVAGLGRQVDGGSIPLRKVILNNGMALIVKENHSARIVAVNAFIKVGAQSEDPSRPGLANLVQRVIIKGTKTRSAESIALETESAGIRLSTDVNPDYGGIAAVSTTEAFGSSLSILADILMNPIFPDEEIEKEKNLILQAIKGREDNPFNSGYDLLRSMLYRGHGYGLPELGTAESVPSFTRDDVLRFYETYYVPNNIIVSVVGDVKIDDVVAEFERTFGEFSPSELPRTEGVALEAILEDDRVEVKRREVKQAAVFLGYLAPKVSDPDYPAMKVINSILGGGFSSRLFMELRERRGWAYNVGSFFPSRKDIGHFVVYIFTSPENVENVRDGILKEIERIKSEDVNEVELLDAKNKIIGQFALDHESNQRQAWYLGWYENMGMGYEYDMRYIDDVSKVTAEDIRRVANRYFTHYALAIIQP
ncbi:MAG: M16 family metallopeptidase [bacterium]